MKTRIIAAAILTLAFAVPVFAADGGQLSNGSGPNFEQRKAEILDRLSNQAANLQQAKDCVQGAKNRDDLRACREKHMVSADGSRAGMRKQGASGGQQGQ